MNNIDIIALIAALIISFIQMPLTYFGGRLALAGMRDSTSAMEETAWFMSFFILLVVSFGGIAYITN